MQKKDDKKIDKLKEGSVKKGGVNEKPTTPRPPEPKGQEPNKEEKINTRELKVKDLRKLLDGQPDEKRVVILSTSGMEWRLNENVEENPKDKKDQLVIYIK